MSDIVLHRSTVTLWAAVWWHAYGRWPQARARAAAGLVAGIIGIAVASVLIAVAARLIIPGV